MIILFAAAAAAATFLGGLFALRFRDKLHLVLGFSAGAVIGVAFFDLLPEALKLAEERYGHSDIISFAALGFLVYLLLDRLFFLRYCNGENCGNPKHRGGFGAGTLSVHSFLDGMAIGLAYQVSLAVGLAVTLAVLAHKFSDGINTVSLVLKDNGTREQALNWLLVGSSAPVLGVLSSSLFILSGQTLGLILAIFCGFFLYIGASDLLPESHHAHPARWTTIATVLGIAVMYMIIKLTEGYIL
ncbi:MAG: permease [Candidatus Moranbacteria bacterium]|nr:permease [Candidatus Moranbacteria bacterium]